MHTTYYKSPIGTLELVCTNSELAEINYVEKLKPNKELNSITKKVIKQLEEYFAGERETFELPLKQKGTIFQENVWQKLTQIPFGETRSYKELARMTGSPKAARAIGNANNQNHIPIIIPCHRVVNADGKLGGYASGTDKKKMLLELEGAKIQ